MAVKGLKQSLPSTVVLMAIHNQSVGVRSCYSFFKMLDDLSPTQSVKISTFDHNFFIHYYKDFSLILHIFDNFDALKFMKSYTKSLKA